MLDVIPPADRAVNVYVVRVMYELTVNVITVCESFCVVMLIPEGNVEGEADHVIGPVYVGL
jgi:hypothetical protein